MTTQAQIRPLRKIVAALCALAFALALVPAAAFAAPVQAQAASTLAVDAPSQEEIRGFYKSSGVDLDAATELDEKPSIKDPYALGEVSETSLRQALAKLNFIRFVAGVHYGVQLDESFQGEFAQAAALLSAANGKIEHEHVQKPAGMTEEMYELGANGAAASNLYASSGVSSLSAALSAWLYDSDSSNVMELGHRRWMLNPDMGKTGFGFVYDEAGKNGINTVASMYAFDASYAEQATQKDVAWPAQNTPVELFEENSAWSISTGVRLNPITMTVKVTRQGDGKTWNFSTSEVSKPDGDIYVSNVAYGQPGCIIFQPKGLKAEVGQTYNVSVSGLQESGAKYEASYDVNFFELDQAITEVTLDGTSFEYTGTAIEPGITVKYRDKVLERGRDYEVTFGNNVNVGTATVAVRGVGQYMGSLQATFKITDGTEGTESINMYRLYNPNSGEHFYTASAYERDSLVDVGWNYEGYGWIAPSTGDAVYRLYNPYAGEHFYTMSTVERDACVAAGWNDEGIGWYSGGEVPLWRQYNPNAYANNHNYTTSTVEFDNLASLGWRYEGISWYAVSGF